jgi:hypothetical protein
MAIASSERLIGTAMGVIGEDFAKAGKEFTKTFDRLQTPSGVKIIAP